MAKENSQKIKLLILMELLRQETDEQHPMAATVVCQKLNDMEVACDRRTLTRDIQALNEYGYGSHQPAANGVESKLCMFYGENHGLSREGKPSNRISRLSEILRWMEEHLKEE